MVWKKPEERAPKKAKVTISAGKVMAMENFKWEIFTHPPYSPELAPSDFHLFPALKWHLRGKHFANAGGGEPLATKTGHGLVQQWYQKIVTTDTSIIYNKKKKYFCEIQEKLNNTYDSSEFWKTIARFRKRNYTQGNISISDWQQFYNKLLDTESIPDYEPVTMTFLNTDNELTKCITLNEISKEISRIRHGKAAGFDDIMNEAIKTLPKDYLISLKDIFNRILRTSEFPTTWLKSVIQPIFKNGDPDDPSNYRGIALLSNIAKLFTLILKSRLGSWIERRNIVPENQAGFRAATLVKTIYSLSYP
ncbi:hypothetical protein LAZ67_5000633 [Cordylochernes scorpioides]|uniref:Reverse transcriptase domain-containing protein n=1 Tax=Cordylochernes scorpioides TaxID=51811 RepID=A0ABY6KG88_9ARAC|nr:hypothetical protein LAZ67_5000633 [Cordylochernes scorpioides]